LLRRHLNIGELGDADDQVVYLRTLLFIEIVSFALLGRIGMIPVVAG
jgi:hypothetical protein